MGAIGRTLFSFLLGMVVGAAGMGWFFFSGAGDVLLRKSPIVSSLEREIDEAEAQRDSLRRQLEAFITRAEESEARFQTLERRLQALIGAAEEAPAPRPPGTPRSASGAGEAQRE
jgi:hypothetical protein